ncbi:MAG: hypothetical protein KatS3mg002_1231 [Candidatus Woesearchaeota archaeon]|nr:MAG: hypothetical protein KatS3mg002_1231 [Candidatus Woesearchaeota archaeon]
MFDFFKKKEVNTLDVPRNLPDLAKDVVEPAVDLNSDSLKSVSNTTDSSKVSDSNTKLYRTDYANDMPNLPNVPSSANVPRLDLNLIKGNNSTEALTNANNIDSVYNNYSISNGASDNSNYAGNEYVDNTSNVNISNKKGDTIEGFISGGLREQGITSQSSFQSSSNTNIRSINKESNKQVYERRVGSQKSLFEELEQALAENNNEKIKIIINNIIPLLYTYHGLNYSKSVVVEELKTLEKCWAILQKKNEAIKSIIDALEYDIIKNSASLLNSDSTYSNDFSDNLSNKVYAASNALNNSKKMSNGSYNIDSANIDSVNIDSANIKSYNNIKKKAPMFVPIIKNDKPNNMPGASDINLSANNFIYNSVSKSEERFYFKDGHVASSVIEFYDILKEISDDTFYHHVSLERNDFSNWFRDVLKQNSLADAISTIYDREDLIRFFRENVFNN